MRILVYPEQLRRTAQTFRWAAGLWNEQAAYLERALNSLHWEVRQRIQMEGQMTHAIRLAWGLAEGAHSKAVFLEQAATRFEVADRQGVQELVDRVERIIDVIGEVPFWLFLAGHPALSLVSLFDEISRSTPMFRPFPPGIGAPGSGEIGKFIKSMKDAAEIFSAFYLISRLHKGMGYPGQVIFRGKSFLKELVGLAPRLTHISAQDLPKHIRKQALLRSSIGKTIFFEGFVESFENWEEYQGDVPRVVVGTLFDTALGTVLTTAGAIGMATLAGAAVATLPVSAPVAAAVVVGGSVLGGQLGDIAAEWLENIKIGGKELDHVVVDFVTDKGGEMLETGKQVMKGIGKFIDKTVSLFRKR